MGDSGAASRRNQDATNRRDASLRTYDQPAPAGASRKLRRLCAPNEHG